MNNISSFLEKFIKLDKENNLKISLILEVIKQITGLGFLKEDLEIKGDLLKIRSNPAVRNEIFMHKAEIEATLKESRIFLNII